MGIIHAETPKDVVLFGGEGKEHLHFMKKFTSQFQVDKMDVQILKATVNDKYLQVGSLGKSTLYITVSDRGFVSTDFGPFLKILCILSLGA